MLAQAIEKADNRPSGLGWLDKKSMTGH